MCFTVKKKKCVDAVSVEPPALNLCCSRLSSPSSRLALTILHLRPDLHLGV